MAESTVSQVNKFGFLKKPKDVTKYLLMRGVTDFGNLAQFNQFESGYPFLIVTGIPKFLEVLREKNTEYATLINNFCHILEYEFIGLSGIDDISSDTSELTNGISNLNVITKVNQQSASNFTMEFKEKAGSIITKVQNLFLTGIKDPRTQVKSYHGLIKEGLIEDGYENEVFSFMYFVTDNTLMNVERAYLIVSAQIAKVDESIFNGSRSDIGFKDVSVEFNGYPITGRLVDEKAQAMLKWINSNTEFSSSDFKYYGLDNLKMVNAKTLKADGTLSLANGGVSLNS